MLSRAKCALDIFIFAQDPDYYGSLLQNLNRGVCAQVHSSCYSPSEFARVFHFSFCLCNCHLALPSLAPPSYAPSPAAFPTAPILFVMEAAASTLSWSCEQVPSLFFPVSSIFRLTSFAENCQHAAPGRIAAAVCNNFKLQSITCREGSVVAAAREPHAKCLLVCSQRGAQCSRTAARARPLTSAQVASQNENNPSSPRGNILSLLHCLSLF